MTARPQRVPPAATWSWPVDLTAYDRSPQLDLTEQEALAVVVNRRDRHRRRDERAMATVDRIMRPIWDLLERTGTHATTTKHVESVLLRETNARQQVYWGWTPQEWLEVLSDGNATTRGYRTRPEQYRHRLLVVAYVLCGMGPQQLGDLFFFKFAAVMANQVFGSGQVDTARELVLGELVRWGYGARWLRLQLPVALAHIMLCNRSPDLAELTTERLQVIHDQHVPPYVQRLVVTTSRALAGLGFIQQELEPGERVRRRLEAATREPADCPVEWARWVKRWAETSTLRPSTRRGIVNNLLQVGRWVAVTCPEVTTPEQWTRELAATYVAAVDRATVGEWARAAFIPADRIGQPLKPQAKHTRLGAIRTFFADGQEWGWFSRRFDPRRSFRTPRSVRSQLTIRPRVIADDIWAKLLWAGLNVRADDLPVVHWSEGDRRRKNRKQCPLYPLELVQAVTVVWLFAGLRSDEIRRLRLGCIRWQPEGQRVTIEEAVAEAAVCWLDVPVNKTSGAFTKPVDRVVGEAVEAWEAVRPRQPFAVDAKTAEAVAYLFSYRGRQIGQAYLNNQLIPLLCRKAGVPNTDARGPITSHRARSTVATQLFNAKEPLSLFELQEWLGHRSPHTTQHYAKITPTKLARSYEQAGYFGRNLRTIEVLIDQDVVKTGAADGEPWHFYDLGHGYCTYDFFDQCPHRMACAKCAFYRPKGSGQAQLLEAKSNLLRLKQEIPLTDAETAAVDDGLDALERLCLQLGDVPTPAGPTPRELAQTESFVPLRDLLEPPSSISAPVEVPLA